MSKFDVLGAVGTVRSIGVRCGIFLLLGESSTLPSLAPCTLPSATPSVTVIVRHRGVLIIVVIRVVIIISMMIHLMLLILSLNHFAKSAQNIRVYLFHGPLRMNRDKPWWVLRPCSGLRRVWWSTRILCGCLLGRGIRSRRFKCLLIEGGDLNGYKQPIWSEVVRKLELMALTRSLHMPALIDINSTRIKLMHKHKIEH